MSFKGVLASVALAATALTLPAAAAPKVPGAATLWYVPGISESCNPVVGCQLSTYAVMNPETQAGRVTLSLIAADGTQMCSISDTVAPMGQILLFSFVCNTPFSTFNGYAVVTSEVPVLVHAEQSYSSGPVHLDAYPKH